MPAFSIDGKTEVSSDLNSQGRQLCKDRRSTVFMDNLGVSLSRTQRRNCSVCVLVGEIETQRDCVICPRPYSKVVSWADADPAAS